MPTPEEIRNQELERDRLVRINSNSELRRRVVQGGIPEVMSIAIGLRNENEQLKLQNSELHRQVQQTKLAYDGMRAAADDANRLISEIKGTMDRWLNDKMPTCCNELLSGLIDAVNDIAPSEKQDSEKGTWYKCLRCGGEGGQYITEKRFCEHDWSGSGGKVCIRCGGFK